MIAQLKIILEELVEEDLHPGWPLQLAKNYLNYFEDANSLTCSWAATEAEMEMIKVAEDEHIKSDNETKCHKETQTGWVPVEVSPCSSIHISDVSVE
ncbi:hypothetical protein AVEN_68550-1 [Araneus ventricosus]|uniref:Uncharacterized protein n=1 Tax=Araneus ventricosus TaxID=182803 RepID=A0A4Y2HCU3_ARAVE|nr:hypothetical protein AVEN_68550-1 [Araneus ventricosus]